MLSLCRMLSLVPRPTPFFLFFGFVDNNTWMRKGGEKREGGRGVLLSTETEEQKKWGRPENEAIGCYRPPHSNSIPRLCMSKHGAAIVTTK